MTREFALVLASQSPRRRQLLQMAGFNFRVIPSEISEIPNENLSLRAQIEHLALDKAQAVLRSDMSLKTKANLILGADTVVVLNDRLLGKPKDSNQAREFLRDLSGQTHEVITGVALLDSTSDRVEVGHEVTRVSFRELSSEEIEAYIIGGEWKDKAGGYGIQGAAGRFVQKVDGAYDNVVGLPVTLVVALSAKLEAVLPRRPLSMLEKNLNRVRVEISNALLKAGRPPGDVRLIAVSKTVDLKYIKEAFDIGQESFGENYAQEALPKVQELPQVDWHYIGALQSNKAKNVVGNFALIHSVDRESLVSALAKAAKEKSITQEILLEVNLWHESTKSGAAIAGLEPLIDFVLQQPNLKLRGLMALPPLTENFEQARRQFHQVRMLFDRIGKILPTKHRASWTELSLGTSSDFEAAILEGATMVRIGTKIFGHRP